MSADEEVEFESLFASKFASRPKSKARMKAERQATMTEKEYARLGRARPVQINFRSTEDTKALAGALAKFMNVTAAEMWEEALLTLAKRKGFKGGADAS